MERFSNLYAELIREVNTELSTLNKECIVYYSEMPWFPGGQFSLSLIKNLTNNRYRLLSKIWDYESDCNRFSIGIFNLDRLCIHQKEIQFSEEQEELITKTLDFPYIPNTIDSKEYIVLDGIDYTLSINTNRYKKEYRWKIPSDDINVFSPLIELIKKLSGIYSE